MALIADNSIKRMLGLMFRKRLGKRECMLFIFDNEDRHPIWMYNMLFPIDVVWLNSNSKIVGIKKNLSPCKSIFRCKEYAPDKNSSYVIELPVGSIINANIKMNSRIRLRVS